MPIKKSKKELAALNRAERRSVRELKEKEGEPVPENKMTAVEKFKYAFQSEHVPMYPHDDIITLTEAEKKHERQLRAVFKLYIELGYNETCDQIMELYDVAIATAKRLIAESKDYFGNIETDDRELDKLLHLQRWESNRVNIINNVGLDEDCRWRLVVECDKQIDKLKGLDKPEQINPKDLVKQLSIGTVIRSTDPKVLEALDTEDIEPIEDGEQESISE